MVLSRSCPMILSWICPMILSRPCPISYCPGTAPFSLKLLYKYQAVAQLLFLHSYFIIKTKAKRDPLGNLYVPFLMHSTRVTVFETFMFLLFRVKSNCFETLCFHLRVQKVLNTKNSGHNA